MITIGSEDEESQHPQVSPFLDTLVCGVSFFFIQQVASLVSDLAEASGLVPELVDPVWRLTPPGQIAFLTLEEKLAQIEADLVILDEARQSYLAQIEEARRVRKREVSGGLAAEEGLLAQDAIPRDSGDEDLRSLPRQVSHLEMSAFGVVTFLSSRPCYCSLLDLAQSCG